MKSKKSSPAPSLFASDWSLSARSTPTVAAPPVDDSCPVTFNVRSSTPPTDTASTEAPHATEADPASLSGGKRESGASPMSPRQPLPVVFPSFHPTSPSTEPTPLATSPTTGMNPNTGRPSVSPGRSSLVNHSASAMSPRARRESRKVDFSEPTRPQVQDDKKPKPLEGEDDLADVEGELASLPVMLKQSLPQSAPSISSKGSSTGKESSRTTASNSRRSSLHGNLDLCMEAGIGHEVKAASYKIGTEKAYHHLQRSNDYFTQALEIRPMYPKAMLAKSKVLIQLSTNYQPPRVAAVSLKEAVKTLRQLCALAPQSVSARETLAQACALLSSILHETDDTADDEVRVWEGMVGKLAREAMGNLEEVAGDRMDRHRDLKRSRQEEESIEMAEMFLALSAAAITVSTLAVDLPTVEQHVELAEQALDQASAMATVAATARIAGSSTCANLMTKVQLASGRSSLERLRHTFVLGCELDEDDFKCLITDMQLLATECRERAVKLKGSKAAAASTLAWEATKMLGDARVSYASLLRLVWRNRRQSKKADTERKSSKRNSETIPEEDENDEEGGEGKKNKEGDRRRSSAHSHARSSLSAGASRKGSVLDSVTEGAPVSHFHRASRVSSSGSPLSASFASARRGSWLPQNADGSFGRSRRLSSMSAPLIQTDGTSAWNRKASIISLSATEEFAGLIPSATLAQNAWIQLEGAIKQYKLALSLLNTCDLPSSHLARAKTETLSQIAYASLFEAALAPRLSVAADKRTQALVTAEVYATWAAREVGWSFLIEGTKEAAQADKRTNSWRADEAGKRAVMLLVRVWWHRAVTTESMDVETKVQAKDAVEVVVRRMRDKEGVRDGDVVRWKSWIQRYEGEMDNAEVLFWKSTSRILRGGSGFVMA